MRLTVGQAIVHFLANQWTERDGVDQRLFAGCFGIFGHGNVAGLGQGLLQAERHGVDFPYYQVRNEQAQVHAASGFAKTANRLSTFACASSIGPGALNMVTGAALATTNRLPVLLLPSDFFARRTPDPVLQQLEDPRCLDVSVNDAFRPVSRFWDRVSRPEQLASSLLAATRVLTDPAETGAATICLPEDVQAEAFCFDPDLFAPRVWHVARPRPDRAALERAAAAIRAAKKPLMVAGGGVIYSAASEELRAFAAATGIPVADTQAGKGAINFDHPCAVGGVGATGAASANALANEADLVIGVGTRYSDFTTASRSVFANPDVAFVNINIAAFDAAKHSALMVTADARETLAELREALGGHRVDAAYSARIAELTSEWDAVTDECYHIGNAPLPAQTEVFGALNEMMGPRDVIINAAGSMPGDLQCLWRASTPEQYHVEYAFSCMGYEIPAAMGARLALDAAGKEDEVVAIVGDGTYQMLPAELATIAAERLKVIVVLLENHGFASIGALSESVGSQRFGTRYRMRTDVGDLGPVAPADLAANAASWGVDTVRVATIAEFREAFARAVASPLATVIHIETDILGPNPPSSAWWDVPVAEVSEIDSTAAARVRYEEAVQAQRTYLRVMPGNRR